MSNDQIKSRLNNFDTEVPLTDIYPRYFVMCRDKWPIVSETYTPSYYIDDYTPSQSEVLTTDLEPEHSVAILKMSYKSYKKYGPFAYDLSSGLQVILSNSKDSETYTCSIEAKKSNINSEGLIIVLTSWSKKLSDDDIITFSLMNDSSDTVSKTDVVSAASSIQPFNFIDNLNYGNILGASYGIIDINKIGTTVDFLTEYDSLDSEGKTHIRSTTATLRGENAEIFSGCWTLDESTQMPKFSLSTMQENLGAVKKYDYELCSKASVSNYAALVSENSLSNNTFCIRDNGDVIFYFEEYKNNLEDWRTKVTSLANSGHGLTLSLFWLDQSERASDDQVFQNCYGRNDVLKSSLNKGFNTLYILASSSFISDGYSVDNFVTAYTKAEITYEIDNELTEKLSNLETQVKNADSKSLIIVDKYSDLESYTDIQEGQKAKVLNDEYNSKPLVFSDYDMIQDVYKIEINKPNITDEWKTLQENVFIEIRDCNTKSLIAYVYWGVGDAYYQGVDLIHAYECYGLNDRYMYMTDALYDNDSTEYNFSIVYGKEDYPYLVSTFDEETNQWSDGTDTEHRHTFSGNFYITTTYESASQELLDEICSCITLYTLDDYKSSGLYNFKNEDWQLIAAHDNIKIKKSKKVNISSQDLADLNLGVISSSETARIERPLD